MSKYSKEDIIRMAREGDVEFIRMQFNRHLRPAQERGDHRQPDREGRERTGDDRRQLHRGLHPHSGERPVSAPRSGFLHHPALAAQHGKVARLICDVYNPDGTPFVGDPRGVLKKELQRAADMGYSFNVGPECEFFPLPDRREGARRPRRPPTRPGTLT